MPIAALADSPPVDIGAPTVLTLALQGTVPTHCGFKSAPAQTATLTSLEQSGTLALPFTLDCNSTFDIRVASSNGGFKLADRDAAAPQGFLSTLDYDVAVSFATDMGSVSDHCAASALTAGCGLYGTVAGQGLSSGDGVGMDEDGAITLTWSAPSQRLIAGQYQDVITVIVEARI